MCFRVLIFLFEEFIMKKERKKAAQYFSKGELFLWFLSLVLILTTFFVFDKSNYLTLAASLIGVTSLIFNAKGAIRSGNFL